MLGSQLLNHVMGQKIAIMSDKAQTTRNIRLWGFIRRIRNRSSLSIPQGFTNPRQPLETSWWSRPIVPFEKWIPFSLWCQQMKPRGRGDDMIIERLKAAKVPVILVVNKIDKVHPDQLLAQIDDFRSQMDFKEIVPISALQGNNVSRLIDILSENLEEGFQYFPADQITDHPERFLVSEMIREKVLHLTREEIPHSVAVVVDSMKRDEETDKVHIRATIMVERDSQKGIVIGKGGAMLKKDRNPCA